MIEKNAKTPVGWNTASPKDYSSVLELLFLIICTTQIVRVNEAVKISKITSHKN